MKKNKRKCVCIDIREVCVCAQMLYVSATWCVYGASSAKKKEKKKDCVLVIKCRADDAGKKEEVTGKDEDAGKTLLLLKLLRLLSAAMVLCYT